MFLSNKEVITATATSANSVEGWSLVRTLCVLLHVLLQIGLLCVTLAAVLADMGLQMLAFLVLGNVLEKGGLVHETFVAGVALVGFVGLMTPGMALEVRQLTERLVAVGVATLVRLVAGVGPDVLL